MIDEWAENAIVRAGAGMDLWREDACPVGAGCPSAPVVEGVELPSDHVAERDGGLEPPDGRDDLGGTHVAPHVVVLIDPEDAGVARVLAVQGLEVLRVL